MVAGVPHFRYSNEVRNLVLIQLAAGVRPTDIADALGVSKPFVSQVKTRAAADPNIVERKRRPKGRPSKIPPYALEAIKDYIAKHPKAERAEVQDALKDRFGIDV